MKKVFKVWSEWDMGFEDVVFATQKLALKALEEAHNEMVKDNQIEPSTLEEMLDEGLYGTEELEFVDGTEE